MPRLRLYAQSPGYINQTVHVTQFSKFKMDNIRINSNPVSDLSIGFEESNCSGSLFAGFQCSCCFNLPRQPVKLPSCSHIFCATCVDKLEPNGSQFSTKNCPICREKFRYTIEFSNFDPLLKILFRKIEVTCQYGCGFKSDPIETGKHEGIQCAKRPVLCRFPRCSMQFPSENVDAHENDCLFRLLYCPECRLSFSANEENEHNCFERMAVAIHQLLEEEKSDLSKIVNSPGIPGETVPFNPYWYAYLVNEKVRDEKLKANETCPDLIPEINYLLRFISTDLPRQSGVGRDEVDGRHPIFDANAGQTSQSRIITHRPRLQRQAGVSENLDLIFVDVDDEIQQPTTAHFSS